ncbi:nuclear transport factor 2 family protein [Piscibacillus sp. B03]|uniref:nuclear transport factor 2 family protein n=1 Tax=Piscibacillus sp. B03 TaxID=3457430 RepID=UPI003FCE93B4
MELLKNFNEFIVEYRESWNSTDANRIASHNSDELKVRWANPDGEVSDWGSEGSKEGWIQAYKQFEGRNPKWYFEDVLTVINSQQEGVAVFWVTFEIDGKLTNSNLLFTETFRQENGEWKKIREYIENGFSSDQKVHT